jgi:hypothetical protein
LGAPYDPVLCGEHVANMLYHTADREPGTALLLKIRDKRLDAIEGASDTGLVARQNDCRQEQPGQCCLAKQDVTIGPDRFLASGMYLYRRSLELRRVHRLDHVTVEAGNEFSLNFRRRIEQHQHAVAKHERCTDTVEQQSVRLVEAVDIARVDMRAEQKRTYVRGLWLPGKDSPSTSGTPTLTVRTGRAGRSDGSDRRDTGRILRLAEMPWLMDLQLDEGAFVCQPP